MPFEIMKQFSKDERSIGNKIDELLQEVERLRELKNDSCNKQYELLKKEVKRLLPPEYTLVYFDYISNFSGSRLYLNCFHNDHFVKIQLSEEWRETPYYSIYAQTKVFNDTLIETPDSVVKLVQLIQENIQNGLEKENNTRLHAVTNDLFTTQYTVGMKTMFGLFKDIYQSLQSGKSIEETAELLDFKKHKIKDWIHSL